MKVTGRGQAHHTLVLQQAAFGGALRYSAGGSNRFPDAAFASGAMLVAGKVRSATYYYTQPAYGIKCIVRVAVLPVVAFAPCCLLPLLLLF